MRSADAADHAASDDPGEGYVALHAWLAARDAVLRGLVHALSNRVGTVMAASGLLEAGSATVAGQVLSGEVDRLERLLEAFRLATTDPIARSDAPELVVLTDVVREAVALHAHADDASGDAVALAGVDDAPPVLVSRAGLLHALLVLLPGAAGIRAAVVGDFVVVQTEPAARAEPARAAAWLLASSGARLGHAHELLVPRLGTRDAVTPDVRR